MPPAQRREQEPSTPSIELAFAKLKACLRAQGARTVVELCDTIKQAFRRFTPNECRNYLVAAGYDAFDPTLIGCRSRCQCDYGRDDPSRDEPRGR